MSEILKGVIIAGGGTLLGLLISFFISSVRLSYSVPGSIKRLSRGVYAVLRVNAQQTKAISSIQSNMQTVIEVIRDGKINGNVTKAMEMNAHTKACIDAAEKIAEDFLTSESAGTIGQGTD
jgi:hypothetical protein